MALGIFGLGTLGQSLAVFGGPLVARSFGWQNVFHLMAAALLAWAVAFALLARNPPRPPTTAGLGAMVRVLRESPT